MKKEIFLPPKTGTDLDGVIAEPLPSYPLIKSFDEYTLLLENQPLKYYFKNPYAIITARTHLVREVTIKWLKEHSIGYTYLSCMVRPFLPNPTDEEIAEYKSAMISELNLDLFIEDESKIIDLLRNKVKCKIVTPEEFLCAQ